MALPTGPVPDRVLLVEGRDDLHVVHHICRRSQPMPDFEIVEKSGIDRLLDSISVELEAPGRRAVGILVDANDDIEARWCPITDPPVSLRTSSQTWSRKIWRWGGTSAPNWPLGFGSCLDRLPTGKFFPRSRHQPA